MVGCVDIALGRLVLLLVFDDVQARGETSVASNLHVAQR
jgi:hypothetical protein